MVTIPLWQMLVGGAFLSLFLIFLVTKLTLRYPETSSYIWSAIGIVLTIEFFTFALSLPVSLVANRGEPDFRIAFFVDLFINSVIGVIALANYSERKP